MAELTNVPILSGNPTRGSMMCAWLSTSAECWVPGHAHLTSKFTVGHVTGGLHRCHLHATLSPLPECCGLGIGHLWMISTGAQSMDGWQCPWLGWGGASTPWIDGPPGGHQRRVDVTSSPIVMRVKHYFFMINCHLKFQIVCVCVFCFNSSRQSESHICIN